MKILTSIMTPPPHELVGVLQREFSNHYSYKLFGLGAEKSIIISKSTFVGAQISKRENEITIEGTIPSITTGYFILFLGLIGPDALLALLYGSQGRKLIKEIGVFLKKKYN